MNKEKDLVITLDNNKKYVKVSSATLNGKNYIYLADILDYKNIVIGELVNDEIKVVNDTELLGQLLVEFDKNIKEDEGK